MTTPETQPFLLALEDDLVAFEDLEALVELVGHIEELRQGLSILEKMGKAKVAKLMDTKDADIGMFHVERRSAATRKDWDHKMMASQVVAAAIDLEEDPVQAILNTATITGWRQGETRRLGIDPDQFCRVEWGNPTVVLRRRTPDEGPPAA